MSRTLYFQLIATVKRGGLMGDPKRVQNLLPKSELIHAFNVELRDAKVFGTSIYQLV
jgi:hypothetical protein